MYFLLKVLTASWYMSWQNLKLHPPRKYSWEIAKLLTYKNNNGISINKALNQVRVDLKLNRILIPWEQRWASTLCPFWIALEIVLLRSFKDWGNEFATLRERGPLLEREVLMLGEWWVATTCLVRRGLLTGCLQPALCTVTDASSLPCAQKELYVCACRWPVEMTALFFSTAD